MKFEVYTLDFHPSHIISTRLRKLKKKGHDQITTDWNGQESQCLDHHYPVEIYPFLYAIFKFYSSHITKFKKKDTGEVDFDINLTQCVKNDHFYILGIKKMYSIWIFIAC